MPRPGGSDARLMEHTLESRFDAGRNNFDALRLGAALVVLLSHSYSLSGAAWEPVSWWLGYGYGGTLAVAVFFVLSGFLVTRSLEGRGLGPFLRGRALRILPGLAFVTAIETFIIAPWFYEGPVAAYFQHFALPHLRNALVFGEDPAIPGVFSGLPFPYVNGSLWTLPVETLFYLLLPLLALAARGRRGVVLLAWLAGLAAEPAARWWGLDDAQFGGFLVQTVRVFSVAEFSGYFLAGVAAWTYRDRVPCSGAGAVLCLLLLWVARGGVAAPVMLKLCLPYLILYAAMAGGLGSRLKRRIGDLSYGVYLFSYPLTNSIIATNRGLTPEVVAGFAAAASLCAAWVSWHLVESPALRWRRAGPGAGPGPGREGAAGVAPGTGGWWRPGWLGAGSPGIGWRLIGREGAGGSAALGQPGANFVALRLFAAGLVVFGNGMLLTNGGSTAYWGAPTSRIGLDLLFAISGYLAVDSWLRRPGLAGFAARRVVRVLPALAVSVVVTVAVIGPLATGLPWRAYVRSSMTLQYLWNIVLVNKLWLPGVFQGQQWSGAVNPMLWTVSAGAALWAVVAASGRLPGRWRLAVLAGAAGACMAAAWMMDPAAPRGRLGEWAMWSAVEAPFFLLAGCLRLVEAGRPAAPMWRADLVLLLFAANWMTATWFGAANLVLEWVSLPYMAVTFGRMSAPVLGGLGRLGNPVLGLFLFAFPVQQLIVARWPGLAHPVLACGAVALAAGYASWHLVERPALRWAERLPGWRLGVLRLGAARTAKPS